MNSRYGRVEWVWGKICAGYTHEIKNILAIINESKGLIDDIHHLNKQTEQAFQEKIAASLDIIQQQVERGERLSSLMNTFAHTPDQEVAPVSIGETLSVLLGLSERFARQKKITLELDEQPKKLTLVTRPVEFMHLLFVGLELALAVLESGDDIRIRFHREQTEYLIRFSLPPKKAFPEASPEYLEVMQDICAVLQSTVRWAEDLPGLLFTFPAEPSFSSSAEAGSD
ncbi:MAG: hypothetical protein K9K64_17365 [Desulfohalobiaceae bacterium]|nr:hypothetical protein [Desulfohalobiaceae bacterium]